MIFKNFKRYFDFEKEEGTKNYYSQRISVFIFVIYDFFVNIFSSFINFVIINIFRSTLRPFFSYVIGFLQDSFRKFMYIVKYSSFEFSEFFLQYPLFNFLIFLSLSFFYFGYFINDAELMLFFSCSLVVIFIGSYISKLLDATLEEYTNSIVFSISEKFSIQLEAYNFEKEMCTRLSILDDFLIHSIIFIEQQINQYTALQSSLFSYFYSKTVENAITLEAEEIFANEHFDAVIAFEEFEKYVYTYLIFELVLEDYEILF